MKTQTNQLNITFDELQDMTVCQLEYVMLFYGYSSVNTGNGLFNGFTY